MKRPHPLVFLLIIMLLGGIGWLALRGPRVVAPVPPRPIAVETFIAETRDVPVWLSGLGSVQAHQTITVRPRVSGELASVNFTEGQEVKAGDLLAQIDPRPAQAALQQALAQKAQDEARLANDRREFERIRGLIANHSESQQLLDQRAATLDQSTAQVQAAQAAVVNTQLQLDFTSLRAPIDGRTGVRLVDAGNLLTANQPAGIVVLTQTRPIAVVFTLPQQDLPAVRRGLARNPDYALVVEARADSAAAPARGQLKLIDNQIDPNTGTLRLKATFANDDQALWPGQFVNARVLVDTLTGAIVVPSEAVQPGLDGPFVYVVKADATVEPRTLQLGPSVDGFTVITAGLVAGEQIVREGQNKLQPGARIEVVKNTFPLPKAPTSALRPTTSTGAPPAVTAPANALSEVPAAAPLAR